MMIKGYIFDYGATLDTAGCHWGKMLWHAYQRQHVAIEEDQFREAYVYAERTLGSHAIIKPDYTFKRTLDVKLRLEMDYLCAHGFWAADEAMVSQKREAVLADVYQKVSDITAHSREVLARLKAMGRPMVVVSNFYGNVNAVLKEFQFDNLFVDVIESAAVGIRKPDPKIFRLGVEALGLPAENVLVTGDSINKDIEPARELGCKTAWFKGEGWTNKQHDETIPDYVITDLSEILAF